MHLLVINAYLALGPQQTLAHPWLSVSTVMLGLGLPSLVLYFLLSALVAMQVRIPLLAPLMLTNACHADLVFGRLVELGHALPVMLGHGLASLEQQVLRDALVVMPARIRLLLQHLTSRRASNATQDLGVLLSTLSCQRNVLHVMLALGQAMGPLHALVVVEGHGLLYSEQPCPHSALSAILVPGPPLLELPCSLIVLLVTQVAGSLRQVQRLYRIV